MDLTLLQTLKNWLKKSSKIHRQEAKELAKGLSQKYFLSENSALECAKNILRYKETHGEKPSEDQTSQMAEIQKTLEGREPIYASQGFSLMKLLFLSVEKQICSLGLLLMIKYQKK
jgi:hypothetical protein